MDFLNAMVALANFNGRYTRDLLSDGRFRYAHDHGKTFTGNCEGSL